MFFSDFHTHKTEKIHSDTKYILKIPNSEFPDTLSNWDVFISDSRICV